MTFEGGHEKADEPSSEQNFNRDGERREHVGSRHEEESAKAAAAEAVADPVAGAAVEVVPAVDAADRGGKLFANHGNETRTGGQTPSHFHCNKPQLFRLKSALALE